jgi:hypothetical protein
MMLSPFDHQRDEELGTLLRAELTGSRPEAFLAGLRRTVAAAERPSEWDVLAGWARPRAMAVAIAAGLLLWLGAWFQAGRSAEGPMLSSLPEQAAVLSQPPAVDDIMIALRERP